MRGSAVSQSTTSVAPRPGTKKAKAGKPRFLGIVIKITTDRAVDEYRVGVVPPGPDGGHAVTFHKLTGGQASYTASCDKAGTRSCECWGHLRWGRCKHADAAAAVCRLFKPFEPMATQDKNEPAQTS